jgi:N-succinyldiaminopimelate aminotransferase
MVPGESTGTRERTLRHDARPLLNRRLDGLGMTIFAEMPVLATATGSINLGQGFPDADGPEEIREAAVRALREGKGNQIPPGPGVP